MRARQFKFPPVPQISHGEVMHISLLALIIVALYRAIFKP